MNDVRIEQDYFDCIFYGTGLYETILSAALQRAGLSVLLIDRNPFYGSQWATLSFNEFDSFSQFPAVDPHPISPPENNFDFKFHQHVAFRNIKNSSVDPEIVPKLRVFQLDLYPFLIPSSGLFLEKVINTGIFKYLSFQLVDGILMRDSDRNLIMTPCSRSELFSTTYFSNMEKYRLNKFFKICSETTKNSPQENINFIDFMEDNGLTPKLVDYISSLICLSDRKMSLKPGLTLLFDVINSAGIYGKSPFLWPLYGCGDIIQAFSRHGAVFGGTCCLNMSINNLVLTEDGSQSIVTLSNGEEIRCKHFFINDSYLAAAWGLPTSEILYRTILFTNKPIISGENLKLLHEFFDDVIVTVLELPFMSGTCPRGYYVVHFTGHGHGDGVRETVDEQIKSLYGEEEILWRTDFELCCGDLGELPDLPFTVCKGPSVQRSCNEVIEDVRSVFSKICPEGEFLEDVILPSDQDFI